MSIFRQLLRCVLCSKDEHDDDYQTSHRNRFPESHSCNQLLSEPIVHEHDLDDETSHAGILLVKPSSTQPKPILFPSNPISSPKSPTSSSKLQQSSYVDPHSSSSKPLQSTFVNPSSTSGKPPTSSSKLQQSSYVDPHSSSSKPLQSTFVNPSSTSGKPPTSSSKLIHSTSSFLKPPTSSSTPTQSSSSPSPCPLIPLFTSSNSSNVVNQTGKKGVIWVQKNSFPSPSPNFPPILKPILPTAAKNEINQTSKTKYVWAEKDSPTITEDVKDLIKKNIVCKALNQPKVSTSPSKPPQALSKSHRSSQKPPKSKSKPSPSSYKLPPVFKPILSPASGKKNYVWVKKDSLPTFTIPEDVKDLIKNDIVPKVLNQPLSPLTYKDYFAALLYAEEFYLEKWSDYHLENMVLELQEEEIYNYKTQEKERKTFVAFAIDSVPQRRPFLLSRDLVYVRPSDRDTEHFQGLIYRIARSSLLVVEFEDDFYEYHCSTQKYDVSFSFNRVCLKRAHQAVKAASEALFQNFLFPDCVSRPSIPTALALVSTFHKLDQGELSAVHHILNSQGSPPYLVAGELCVELKNLSEPSRTGLVICEAILQLYQMSLENRILICSPNNRCCDVLLRSLMEVIPESDMFRANAAFREIDEVLEDILPSCQYTVPSCPHKDPYFSCPPTQQLRKFRVISSTFMSSYRLHDQGITCGHFSHVFLLDASSATEPETVVTLTNFVDESTTVIVTGKPGHHSRWVRANIAREKGLKVSYFERLLKCKPYRSLSPMFISQLGTGNRTRGWTIHI